MSRLLLTSCVSILLCLSYFRYTVTIVLPTSYDLIVSASNCIFKLKLYLHLLLPTYPKHRSLARFLAFTEHCSHQTFPVSGKKKDIPPSLSDDFRHEVNDTPSADNIWKIFRWMICNDTVFAANVGPRGALSSPFLCLTKEHNAHRARPPDDLRAAVSRTEPLEDDGLRWCFSREWSIL